MIFSDLSGEAADIKLPSHIAPEISKTLKEESVEILRQHFLRCLDVHFVGGDILSDLEHGEIEETISGLGLSADCEEDVNLYDEKWQTPLGKALFKAYMEDNLL